MTLARPLSTVSHPTFPFLFLFSAPLLPNSLSVPPSLPLSVTPSHPLSLPFLSPSLLPSPLSIPLSSPSFDLRDITTVVTSLARLLKPRVATNTVVRCWASLMHAVYALRMPNEADLLRFRTVLQDITRKQFSLNILPRTVQLPLWVHPKLLGEDTSFVFQEGIHGGLLHARMPTEANTSTDTAANSATATTAAAVDASTPEDTEVKITLEPVTESSGKAGSIAGLRLLSALHSSYTDCHVRYAGFALHLRAAHLPVLTQLVASLRNRGCRPNPLLVGEAAADVIRLTAQIAGSEVVFADQLQQPGGHARFRTTLVDLIMRAGTREERVIFALPLDQCDPEVLSPLASFITAGEISDLLSPDNMVAVSTLTQPRVLAAGLQPSLSNAWRYFKEAMRRNLRVVLYLPPWGPHVRGQLHGLLAYSPSMLSCLNVVIWPACAQGDLFEMAQEHVDKLLPAPRSAGDLEEYLGPLLTAMHQSVLDCVAHPAASVDAEMLRHVSATDFDLFVRQAAALIRAQWQSSRTKIVRMQRGVELTHRAETRVRQLQNNRGDLEGVLREKEAITTRLLAQLGRDAAALRKSKAALATEQQRLDDQRAALPEREREYRAMLSTLRGYTNRLRRLVASIADADVKELQSLARPPQSVEAALQAVLLLVNEANQLDESDLAWRTGGKRLCSDIKRFRATLAQCETRTLPASRLEDVTLTLEDESVSAWATTAGSVSAEAGAADTTRNATGDDALDTAGNDGTANVSPLPPNSAEADSQAPTATHESPESSEAQNADVAENADTGGEQAARRARRIAAKLQESDHVPTVVPRLVQWASTAVELHTYLNNVARPLEEQYKQFDANIGS